ncbi:MAG: hypothetical protein JWN87_1848 [Frankiales bacterium]|nr:hypothetical protein [Frankiales bacterium]
MTLAPLRQGDPAQVGPCRLLGRLGQGGMGTVYLGVLADDRAVAVKVLRDGPGDEDGRRRFRQELAALERVRGPHLVEVLDADVVGDNPWIMTRFVPGRRLDEVVALDGPLHGAALDRLARGLAEALFTLHAAGVVHRDVTPSNVLLVDGEPHLVDLGLALAADVTALTRSGTVIGTPGYLAPEQVLGQPATAAIDVHAWGATVALAGTGRPPYGTGRPEAVLYRVVHDRPDLAGLTGPVADLVLQATAAAPLDRPTAAELLHALGGPSSAPDLTVRLSDLEGATSVLDLGQTRQLVSAVPAPRPPSSVPPPTQVLAAATVPPTSVLAADPPGGHEIALPPPVVRPGRLRVASVAPAALAAVGGLTVLAPAVAAAAVLLLLAGLQTTTRSRAVLTVRRERRGARRRDPAIQALALPWHLLRGLGDVLAGLPLAVVVGGPFGAGLALLLKGRHGASLASAYGAALAVLAVLAVQLSRRSTADARRLLGRGLLRATPTASAGFCVVAVLLVVGAVGVVLATDTGVHWWPVPTPAW